MPRTRTNCETFDEVSSHLSRAPIAMLSSMLLGMTLADALTGPTQLLAGTMAALGVFYCCFRLLVPGRVPRTFPTASRRRKETRLAILIGPLREPRPTAILM